MNKNLTRTRSSEPAVPAAGQRSHTPAKPEASADGSLAHARTRRGYTLIEMIISTGAATVLLGGLMSTIVVANRAWSPDLKPAIKAEASGLTRQLGIDLKSALYFTERTSAAVTFAVPDRNSDGQPEKLRYAWSETAGDPLTVSLNGGTAQVVVADVQTFNMDFLLRNVVAPVIPVSGQNQSIVFISETEGGKGGLVDRGDLAKEDQARIDAIESWGFTVSVLSGYASDNDWAAGLDDAAAVYVPGSVDDREISKRLYYENIGVVFETSTLSDETRFSTRSSTPTTSQIDLENTNHYITSTLTPGLVSIAKSSQPLLAIEPAFCPDLEVLARSTASTYTASLAVLEANARTSSNDSVPARRVLLPWGANAPPFDELTDAALTIMERSITWAAKLDDSAVRRRVLYFVENIAAHDAREFDRKIMFESAGLEVRRLNRSTDSDVIAKEIFSSNAIYIPAYLKTDNLLAAVNDTGIGIVAEGLDWTVPLGFSTDLVKTDVIDLNIKEKDHKILAGFSGDTITMTTGSVTLVTPGGDLAKGAVTILETSSSGKGSALPAVVVIEKGGVRADGTTSSGRRTLIPYDNTLRANLTSDGYRLIQQAVDWTAQQPEVVVESFSSQSFSSFLKSLSR